MENNELSVKVNGAVQAANNVTVKSDIDYSNAGNIRKELKYTLKQIKDYWEPKKDQAFQLHKSLVAAEKEMTQPLEQADKIIDTRMGEYRREQERIRQEQERERRRIEEEARHAAEEAARLAAEAAEKDELDDDDVEILCMAQADLERTQSIADVAPIISAPVTMQGISVTKTWKSRVINDALVPVMVGRTMLRPIDMGELNKLARAGVDVPGVEFYQEESTRVRL